MGNKNKRPTVPALQKRKCGPIHKRDKDRIARPCMAGRWKFVERSIDIYGKRKEIKGKTMEKVEGQRQGIIRKKWSELGAGIR